MALKHEIVPFGNWGNNLRVSNGVAEILITLDVGPRILSFAATGGRNVFKIFEDQVGTTGEPMWQSRGGHRLWLAPEGFPFSYPADNDAVDYEIFPNGTVTVTAPDEIPQGFSKQLDISLHPTKAAVRVVHRVTNIVDEEQEVAAWMLSVMDAGGTCIIPQTPVKPHPGMGPGDFTADRSIILWPFTDLTDGRWHLGRKFFTLTQDAALGATKMGLNFPIRWVAYHNHGTLFVKRFAYDAKASYPDRNSVFETFANEDMLEVETLGPLTKLAPGKQFEVVEEWELFTGIPAIDPHDDESIEAALKGTGLV